jgi:hypothetical protein
MKKALSIFSLAAGALMFLASCGPTSHIEVAKGVDFKNYKTFGWTNDSGLKKAGRVNNDIVDNNIKNSIATELEEKGWQESDQQPDVLLDYNVTVQKGVKQQTVPIYPYSGSFYMPWRHRMGYYYNPAFFGGYTIDNVPFREGILTVNMMDAKVNKLIWQGSASGDITSKNVTSKEAQADVKSIFKKLNLPNG